MAITFYDLAGEDGRKFSPYCWRVRMALAHKDLDYEHKATPFTAIPEIGGEEFKTVPIILDGERMIGDSTRIAEYLEVNYSDRQSLFGSEEGQALCKFIHSWTNSIVHPSIASFVLKDIYDHVCTKDKKYIRHSREKIFGKSLEMVQAGRENRLDKFWADLHPLRLTVRNQPFLGGKKATYADYIVFGAFQWARTISDFKILTDDDPIFSWFLRCGNLFNGLGRNEPGYY